jgi:AraC-like DNA-binding protein
VVIVGYVKMKRYLNYVRREFSNIDQTDVSWLRPVFFFAIVGQLAWLFTSLFPSVLTDILYYAGIILLWLVVLHYSWNFRPIIVPSMENVPLQKTMPPITQGSLEQLVEGQKLYLHPDLTLQELAQALGTNRTYVSNYISQVMGQSFYDYINQLRIERSALPLVNEHPEYTFEYVARQSGFASMSTFRRAFIKKTGLTPSQYVAMRE